MSNYLEKLTETTGMSAEILMLSLLAISVFLLVFGVSSAFAGPTPEQRRIRAAAVAGQPIGRADVVRLDDNDPTGLLRAFVPRSQKERSDIAKRLRQGGVHTQNAVLKYYLAKTVLALLFPALFVGLKYLPDAIAIPIFMREMLDDLTWLQTLSTLIILMLAGFFLPALWLKSRIDERRKAIEHGLPNAMDLLTVGLESGMGFDAAMTRVAHEIAPVVPEVSQEFTILQLELQAGKDRNQSFRDLADRCGVEEVSAFSNVVIQSIQFGTSIGDSLAVFSQDMRQTRELRAQEKANKLPVKMSAVLAALMMPVLLMICLTPIMIRWMRMFAEL